MKIGKSDKENMVAAQKAQSNLPLLEVGSAIQYGDPVQYGTIERLEDDPVLKKRIADVELVNYLLVYVQYVHIL